MTRAEMYKELSRLYRQTDWSSLASIHRYNETARLYRQKVAEHEERECKKEREPDSLEEK